MALQGVLAETSTMRGEVVCCSPRHHRSAQMTTPRRDSMRDMSRQGMIDGARYRYRPDLAGYTPRSDPQVFEPDPIEVDSVLAALLALAAGQVRAACDGLEEIVASDPDDSGARRLLGLTLIELGEVERGVGLVGAAYSLDPGLEPIDAVLYESRRRRRLRDLVTDVVRHANRHPSAEAWLTVTVLMQGEGRPDRALRMLAKAERLGLDPVLVGVLEGSLRR